MIKSWSPDPDRLRNIEENYFYKWITDHSATSPVFQIVKDAGFLVPFTAPCNDPSNIACVSAPFGLGTPKQNIGAETEACNSSYPCVATGAACSSGTCPVIPSLNAGYACNVADATHAGPKCSTHNCSLDIGLSNLAGKCQ